MRLAVDHTVLRDDHLDPDAVAFIAPVKPAGQHRKLVDALIGAVDRRVNDRRVSLVALDGGVLEVEKGRNGGALIRDAGDVVLNLAPSAAGTPTVKRARRRVRANLWLDCRSGGDRPKPSDLSVARTADPIPLSIQGVKRATAPQARTPEDAGGWGRGGCGNVYKSVGPLQPVVFHFHGVCAAPRNSGGDRAPIDLPIRGTALLYCREKRTLLLGRPGARLLIHGDGSLSDTEENRVTSRPRNALSKKSRAAARKVVDRVAAQLAQRVLEIIDCISRPIQQCRYANHRSVSLPKTGGLTHAQGIDAWPCPYGPSAKDCPRRRSGKPTPLTQLNRTVSFDRLSFIQHGQHHLGEDRTLLRRQRFVRCHHFYRNSQISDVVGRQLEILWLPLHFP